MTKKMIATILFVVFTAGLISGCVKETADDGKINIVCTVFPVYDWIQEITEGEEQRFSVTLLSGGGDLHSFQPSARDIAQIHSCDLVVTVGGTTDKWTEEIELSDSVKRLSLFDILEETEKLISGEDAGEHHNHEGHSDDEYDEHIWLSLTLAERMTNALCEELCDVDPERGVVYQKNTMDYCQKLKDLDAEYRSVCEKEQDKTVIFADRFPFAYMMKDYKITCYAAFPGCSSDSEASFETVAQLSEMVKKHNKKTVLVLENSNQAVANAINNALDGISVDKAVMDSCQTINQGSAGKSDYIEIMKKNLEALESALM